MLKFVSHIIVVLFVWLAATFLLISPVIAVGSRAQDNNDMSEKSGANIAKFNLESVSSFWSAAGCTFLSSGCADSDGNSIIKEGAFESGGQAVAYLITTPPVHTATYVADVIHNLRLPGVEPAYAQGIGFSALSPILRIWKAFRNLAYFIYIIVFVVIGFMIMFRKKISSNAIITIQEALPKLIVTLLLITFSYAIAGFAIDLIYVVIIVVLGLFQQFGIITDITQAQNAIFGYSIFRIAFRFLIGTNQAAGEAAQSVSYLIEGLFSLGRPLTWITNGLGYLIIAVGLVIAMFRTLFQLVTAYIGIIVSVIFAPIQLLANAFPGSDAFEKWIRGLLANAAVFPAVAIILILGAAIVGTDSGSTNSNKDLGLPDGTGITQGQSTGWVPPLLMTQNSFGNANGPDVMRGIIGIGMIFLLPEIVKIVKETLKVKENYGEMAMKNARSGDFVGGLGKMAGGVAVGGLTQAAGTGVIRFFTKSHDPTPDPNTEAATRQRRRETQQIGRQTVYKKKIDQTMQPADETL